MSTAAKYFEVLSEGRHKNRVYVMRSESEHMVSLWVPEEEEPYHKHPRSFKRKHLREVIPKYVPFDLDGKPIDIGDRVVFAAMGTSSPELCFGMVTDVKVKNKDGSWSKRPLIQVKVWTGQEFGFTFDRAKKCVMVAK